MELTMNRACGKNTLAACGTFVMCLLLLGSTGCEMTNPELRHRGRSAYLGGNYERSRDFYAQAVRQNPTDVEAQYGLGRAHLELDQPRDAHLAFEEAMALASDDQNLMPRILDGLAEALYRLERQDRLHAFLQHCVERYGTTRDYLRQGDYLARIGDMDGAEGAYRRAAHFAPDGEVEPFLALARFYENRNDMTKSVRALRWAYYVDPHNPEVVQRLRDHGLVPGPTVAEEPDRALLRP